MKITKKLMEEYISIKGKLSKLKTEEKKLKNSLLEGINDKKFIPTETGKSFKQTVIAGFELTKTVSVTPAGIDYIKFYEMYYDPNEHTIVPTTAEKKQTSYKFTRKEG